MNVRLVLYGSAIWGGALSSEQPSGDEGSRQEAPSLRAGEGLPSDPPSKRSFEKRARLKAAGLVLFAEKGFERTSIDGIARRAKLAVGGFYQHFHSKRQLLLVLMDELLEKLAFLQRPPGARSSVDIPGLAGAMDAFFWSLVAQAAHLPNARLNRQIDSATHLIYHALFVDRHQ